MFYSEAQGKINTLKRGAPFLNIEKSTLIMNAFTLSHVDTRLKFAIYCD